MLAFSRKFSIGPGSTWAGLCWLFVLVTVSLVIFLLSASFTRRERVSGLLTAEPQIVRVVAPHAGRVGRVAVREGQSVRRGEVLLEVDPDPVLVGGKISADAEIDRIRRSEKELEDRLRSIAAQTELKADEIAHRIEAVEQQVSALRSGAELKRQSIPLLRDQLESARRLVKSGTMSAVEMQKREAALSDSETVVQTLLSSLYENQAALAELKGQEKQLPLDAELRTSDLRQSLIELEQRRTEAEGRRAYQITAPIDGTVDAILVVSGQSADAASTVLSMFPTSSTLVAELYVPSRAIAFVEPAQAVQIAYDAFPYARYGLARGTILSVSEVILRPDEIQRPLALAGPTYRVTVALAKQTVTSGAKEIRLRPGLTLAADIVLDRRSLAQWILHSARELWVRA